VRFSDYSLLLRALTHRSFLNENPASSWKIMSAWSFWAMPCWILW
jgi:dsRNA-specific ribonuclease